METQKKIVSKGFQTVFDENKKAWLKKQNSSFIKVDDVKMLKAYNTALYFLRSLKTKWSIPISLYSHGQHWNGAYFTWDNAFSVAGLCAAGDFETAKNRARVQGENAAGGKIQGQTPERRFWRALRALYARGRHERRAAADRFLGRAYFPERGGGFVLLSLLSFYQRQGIFARRLSGDKGMRPILSYVFNCKRRKGANG